MKFKFGFLGFLIIFMLMLPSCGGRKTRDNNTQFQDNAFEKHDVYEEKNIIENELRDSLESKTIDTVENVSIIEETIKELILPPHINLFQFNRKSMSPSYGYPEARIWGWSKNGKAAYSIESAIDGRGGRIINFTILNLITDEAVYELEIDSFNFDDIDNEALYNIFKMEILEALNEHGITYEKTPFISFPFKRNNIEYNARIVDIEYKNDEYGFFDKVVSGYKVSVSANSGRKIIDNSVPGSSVTGFVYVCGCFISPFENRALVVTAEEAWVFEGTELFYKFIGCHLGVGFN